MQMKEMSKKNFCLCLTRVSEASRRVDSLIKVVGEDLKMALMAILLLHSDITINERKREKKKNGAPDCRR